MIFYLLTLFYIMAEMLKGYKTYVGIIIALAPNIAHIFGYQLSASFASEFPAQIDTFITIAGLIFAAYGRLKAEAPGWLSKK